MYGGGRLAAYVLAQCLARAGAAVAFVTNAWPVFHEELRHLAHPAQVAFHLTRDFLHDLPEGAFDAVLLVPGQSQDRAFYAGARGFARRRGARLVLFSFETPNWFNQLAPQPRDESLWREWRACLEDGCLVLANSAQSERFARRYYLDHPTTTAFAHWHQPINTAALARARPQFRERRLVAFLRPRDPHKGGQDLLDALSDDLRGWTLVLLVGAERLDEGYARALEGKARRHGIATETRTLLSDTEKFVELRRARLLLYPSRFEGYGIPPIEALACATPCVCYDLPVLREVCGDALLTSPPGDIPALQANIRRVTRSHPSDWQHLPHHVQHATSLLRAGEKALDLLRAYRASGTSPPLPPPAAATAPVECEAGWVAGGREEASGFVTGWVTAASPIARLYAAVGGRSLWVQGGLAGPGAGRASAQGFAIHLGAEDLAALDAAEGRLTLSVETEAGTALLPLRPAWAAVRPGRAEFPPPEAPGAPPRAEIQRATCDEYGVIEVEGWVLAQPRVEAIRVWAEERLIGETVPDRASLGAHERHREYGDAFGGFHLAGRLPGQALASPRYRVEFLVQERVVLALGGHARPLRRAGAALGSDAALLPPGFLEEAGRGPLVALVVEDGRMLEPLEGAGLRALLAHLRRRGFEILLLLHGNPHRFADDLPRWRALAEGVLLVNPVTPGPTSALPGVLASLAAAAPRLAAVIADRPGLAPALAPLAALPVRRLVVAGAAPLPAMADPPVALRLDSGAEVPAGPAGCRIGFDGSGLAAQVEAQGAPALPEGPWLAIDATRAPEAAVLREVLSAAGDEARRRGWGLALVVGLPPLAAEAPLRTGLGLGDEVALVWPVGLAASAPGVRMLVQPRGDGPEGAVTAAALAQGIPVVLWSGAAAEGWGFGGRRVLAALPLGDPYGELDALLAAGGTLPDG
ncbi:glycosyltransferase [Roseomonas nepalensis]|uniref:Glycosyltransferase n=1 Tax=Muricoccus nepalensis TaxID=1854500 RepID=A0A502GFR8_9PROT|nr:glycosyltransferase [Roseomonas nepalensis]